MPLNNPALDAWQKEADAAKELIKKRVNEASTELQSLLKPKTAEEWARAYNLRLFILTHDGSVDGKNALPTLLADHFTSALKSKDDQLREVLGIPANEDPIARLRFILGRVDLSAC